MLKRYYKKLLRINFFLLSIQKKTFIENKMNKIMEKKYFFSSNPFSNSCIFFFAFLQNYFYKKHKYFFYSLSVNRNP
jgi:hypothetical protein